MAVQLSQGDFQRLTRTLAESPGFALAFGASQLLNGAFAGVPRGNNVLGQIALMGAAQANAVEVITVLSRYGQITSGREALSVLLDYMLDNRGEDETTEFLRGLFDHYPLKQVEQLPLTPASPVPAVEKPLPNGNQQYIFISYARPESPLADQVEAYLSAAGFRVFRDINSIQPGDDWNMKIEEALHQATHMVLLLSDASMPYRKEVYREWFAFDQMNKPILPLYVKDCKLPTRLIAINYTDARADLAGALKKVTDAIIR